MTEEEWLACEEPDLMVSFLKKKYSDRKLRLFSCTCCRRIWPYLQHEDSRRMVEIAERYADDITTGQELDDAIDRAEDASYDIDEELAKAAAEAAFTTGKVWHMHLSQTVVWVAARDNPTATWDAASYAAERAVHRALLRDIFGNPFRPVAFDPIWRTSDVMILANGIYAERAYDRMPILADALQDAGCDNDDILTHLRDVNATHVRGCWVLDLVLGKE